MKYIPLTRGLFAMVDDDDYDWLNQFRWQAERKPNGKYEAVGYWWLKDGKGKPVKVTGRMHQLVSPAPRGKQVDHKDRNSLNNQSENLRPATQNQNCQNRSKPNKLGYKGVRLQPNGKYYARITVEHRRLNLGVFETLEEAAEAYNEAALKHFGEFALPNKIRKKGH